jgi:hypothetical protein
MSYSVDFPVASVFVYDEDGIKYFLTLLGRGLLVASDNV